MLDRGGQLKISGFGLIKLSKVSEDNVKVVNHEAHIDKSSKKQCFIFFISLLETLFLKVLVLIITFWTADCYIAPELYKNIIFDKSVDVHSFGVILYEVVTHKTFILLIVIKDIWTFGALYVKMTEGVSIFHPKSPEEVAESICMEGRRPTIKTKSKGYPSELKE